MKIEQIAFTGANIDQLKKFFRLLGAMSWVEDTVDAKGLVYGNPAKNRANLHFNYDLGFELELLEYVKGDNWLDHREGGTVDDGRPELSHIGLHVNRTEMAEAKIRFSEMGIGIAQEVITIYHTNPGVKGRTYHYVVFDSADQLGFDFKLIERLAPCGLCEINKCTLDFDVQSHVCINCMKGARNNG